MAAVLPFSAVPRLHPAASAGELVQLATVLRERAEIDDEIVRSLPELLAAQHRLSQVVILGELFAVCACGHWQQVFATVPPMCGLEWVISLRDAMTPRQFLRDLSRTYRAGRREEQYASRGVR